MTDDGLHLSVDELADVLAGEGDDRHLASCAHCTHRLAELRAAEAAVTARLAALPDPLVPADLAARLEAAFAGERPPRPAAGGATVTPLASRRRAWVPAVAASAVLLMGGVLGWSVLHDRAGGGSDDTATSAAEAGGAARSADDALPRSASGADYGDDAAVKAVIRDVLAGTAVGASLGAAQPAPAAGTTQDSSAGSAGDPLQRLREPEGLASCLAALLPPEEPDVRPLALDYATYKGAPALAVVLPDPDPARLSVFVVGPGCSQADDGTLRFVRVDKP